MSIMCYKMDQSSKIPTLWNSHLFADIQGKTRTISWQNVNSDYLEWWPWFFFLFYNLRIFFAANNFFKQEKSLFKDSFFLFLFSLSHNLLHNSQQLELGTRIKRSEWSPSDWFQSILGKSQSAWVQVPGQMTLFGFMSFSKYFAFLYLSFPNSKMNVWQYLHPWIAGVSQNGGLFSSHDCEHFPPFLVIFLLQIFHEDLRSHS